MINLKTMQDIDFNYLFYEKYIFHYIQVISNGLQKKYSSKIADKKLYKGEEKFTKT